MVEIFFNGANRRIEGDYHASSKQSTPVALVLHPHPRYGSNAVISTLCKVFIANNFSVLTINFHNSTKTNGATDKGLSELGYAATALDWLQNNHPLSSSVWVSGFSFGAWVAMQLMMRRPEVRGFITLSPPVDKYDFSFLSPCPVPGLVVQGNQDSIAEESSVLKFINKVRATVNSQNIVYHVIDGADHFFRDCTDELEQVLERYLRSRDIGNVAHSLEKELAN